MLVITRKASEKRTAKTTVFFLATPENLQAWLDGPKPRQNSLEILLQVGSLGNGSEVKMNIEAPQWVTILRGELIENLMWRPNQEFLSRKHENEYLSVKIWRSDLRALLRSAGKRRLDDGYVVLLAAWFKSVEDEEATLAVASPCWKLDVSHELWPTCTARVERV